MNTNELLLQQLNWRYATKKFDAERTIPADQWKTLESAVVLTPSSYGLQLWKAFVVTEPTIREKLVTASWGQRQVADSSHFVVFAIRKDLDASHVDHYLKRISEVRNSPVESLDGFRTLLLQAIDRTPEDQNTWARSQAYIGLGNLLTSAALLGLDSCPMEGFDPAQYDEILGLEAQGFHAVVACAIGYRAEDDKYASLPKVRLTDNEIVERIA